MFEFLPAPETVCYRDYVDAVTRYMLVRDERGGRAWLTDSNKYSV